MNSSASMYGRSGLIFQNPHWNTIGQDAFDESRLVMTFLTFLRVTHVLCNFRLVLEGKAGEEIPESSRLKFLEKFLANHCALSDAGDDTSKPLNRGSIADLPLLIILIAIRQIS